MDRDNRRVSTIFPILLREFGVLAAYALLALAYSRPLLSRFSTHYIGLLEVSCGVWNHWHFRHCLTEMSTNPLWTEFQYWPYGSNLLLHHYTLVNDLIAFLLLPGWGSVVTYNLIFVLNISLAGYGVFLLARDWGCGALAAFVGGAAYAFSPAATRVIADIGGADYMGFHALPFFVWTFARALRGGRLRDCAFSAACLTWVLFSDYYYFLFCVLLVFACYLRLARPIRVTFSSRRPPRRPAACRLLEAAAGAALVWIAVSIYSRGGQVEFHGRGSLRLLLGYLAPYVAFWSAVSLRLLASYRPELRLSREAFTGGALKPYLGVLGFTALVNLPFFAAMLHFLSTGNAADVRSPWRGGGNPLDPVFLLLPNYFHPVWGEWAEGVSRLLTRGEIFRASLGWLPLAAAVWLYRRARADRWTSLWLFGFAFSVLMTMGPWLKVFGFHTYLPLPFYFVHLLPVFSSMQTGFRFVIFAALFLAILLAAFLKEAGSRLPPARRRGFAAAVFLLLALEFFPREFPMASSAASPLIERLGERPFGAVLPVPMGAIFNGLSPNGAVGRLGLDPILQPIHKKPTVGGYLGRVSRRLYEKITGDAWLSGLIRAQDGAGEGKWLRDREWAARYLREMNISYVLLMSDKVPAALNDAVSRWPLRLIDSEGPLRLFAVEPRLREPR